jgi:succinyl-diaminopimelate desuccinylase
MNIDWLNEATKRKNELFKDLQAWIQIPSVYEDDPDKKNYPMGKANRAALDYYLELGANSGFETKKIDNLAGHIEYTQGEEIVGIIGHSDVVPVGDGWYDDPFSGNIKDGFMYGRGTQDDKGPMMAAFYALKIIKELDLPLTKTVRLINGTDEESGLVSSDAYFAAEAMPVTGFSPDASFPVIFGEKGILTYEITTEDEPDSLLLSFASGTRANVVPDTASATITSKNKNLIEKYDKYLADNQYTGGITAQPNNTYELTIEGASAHGSTPDAGVNASFLLMSFLKTLKLNSTFVELFTTYFLNDTTGSKLAIAANGEMGPLTSNIGIVNYEARRGTVVMNIRYPHEWDIVAAADVMGEAFKPFGARLTEISHKGPLYVPTDDPLVQTLERVYRKQTGSDEPLLTIGGGTYARSMDKAVAFGMLFQATEDRMHQKNERIPLEDLLKATAIYAEAIYELAK